MTKFDFVLVDAMNLSYRSWWKVKDLKTSKGIPTGLEYGFINAFGSIEDFSKLWSADLSSIVFNGKF
jgi:5'-3' exonuclease